MIQTIKQMKQMKVNLMNRKINNYNNLLVILERQCLMWVIMLETRN